MPRSNPSAYTFTRWADHQVAPKECVNDLQVAIEDIDANGTVGGGSGLGLVDPNADRIVFWDDSAGGYAYLVPGTNLSISGTTLNATGGGTVSLPSVNVKTDFGAVGNGTTDDTTSFTNALAAIAALSRPIPLIIPAGKYLVPNGITESIRGLTVLGANYSRILGGGGTDHSPFGVVIVTTAAGAWCWTHKAPTLSNVYEGGFFQNIMFQGNASTAGGFRNLMVNNTKVVDCQAEAHTTGFGFLNGWPSPSISGADASWSTFDNCGTMNCKIGFVDGWGDDGCFSAHTGSEAADTVYDACYVLNNTAGGIANAAGTIGFWHNSNARSSNCKAEGAEIGFLGSHHNGVILIAPRAEGCTTGFKLGRGHRGTATSGTTTSLTQTGAGWATDRWKNWTLTIESGTGVGQSATITGNTATTISFAALGTAPNATSVYRISRTFSSRSRIISPLADSSTSVGIEVTANQLNDSLVMYDTLATTNLIDNGVTTRKTL